MVRSSPEENRTLGPWGKSEAGDRPDRLFWIEGWLRCSTLAGGLVVLRLLLIDNLKEPSPEDDLQALVDFEILSTLIDASFEKLPRGRPPRCFACRRYILDERRPLHAALVLQPYCETTKDMLSAYGVCEACTEAAGGDKQIFEALAERIRATLGARNIGGQIIEAPGRA
jgi:hypothetical protein